MTKKSFMRQASSWLLAAIILLTGTVTAFAQDVKTDQQNAAIVSIIKRLDDKFICPGPVTLATIQQRVDDFLRQPPLKTGSNLAEIEKAMLVLFPCPFPPNTKEDLGVDLYRPAVEGDIEGSWIFPETSQKFKFGPKSPNWSRTASFPIKCECITYNPDGSVLHAESGATVCPFSSAKAVENIFRPFPRVEFWKLTDKGKVKISRTDVPNHIEEWEIFVVIRPHARYGVPFDVGDLVAYQRRNEGNELYAATMFRHLKRLP
ncbi:MAG: hypothetical protein P4L87_22765 [Formivibrio sp.]|nr:hypothetical protein [Formivibrio sp.]